MRLDETLPSWSSTSLPPKSPVSVRTESRGQQVRRLAGAFGASRSSKSCPFPAIVGHVFQRAATVRAIVVLTTMNWWAGIVERVALCLHRIRWDDATKKRGRERESEILVSQFVKRCVYPKIGNRSVFLTVNRLESRTFGQTNLASSRPTSAASGFVIPGD